MAMKIKRARSARSASFETWISVLSARSERETGRKTSTHVLYFRKEEKIPRDISRRGARGDRRTNDE